MIRINLLPVKEAQKKEMLIGQVVILAVAVSIVVLGCLGGYLWLQGQVKEQQRQVDEKQTEINQLKKVLGKVREFEKKQKELRSKLDVLGRLKENRSGPVHLLDELSAALAEGVWVELFNEKGGAIAISAIGLSQEAAAVFLRNLEASPYFKNVSLLVINQKSQGDVVLHQFKVICAVETPPKKK
ncbi:MAG: PilN domain-containing protein [Desulfuromonadales bacterium]|nr:PilN domain-containing protein [Desulfuromonadales bacterium]